MRMRSASISATKSAVSAAASSPARKPATATRVPKFLRCLYDILHMEDQSILSWSKDGTHFQIYSTKRLEVEILPKYFKHGKFASFQRQLNNFGFRKWTKTQSNVCTFSHNHYVRRHPQQLVELVVQQNEALAKADVTGDKLTPHGSQGGKRKRSDSASEKSVKTIKREPQSYVVQRPAALPLAKVDATAFDFEVESWSLMADISPLEWATKSHLTAVKTESGNETPTSAAGFADMTFDFTLEELDDILLTGNATENEHAIDMRVLSECYGFGVPAVEPEPWAEGPELIPADLELYMQDTEIWASH